MNWDSICQFIIPAGSAYILLWFMLIRPLNKRYKKALATLLGKEIARSLYQQMHPEFTYATKKYHPSDSLDETVLNTAKEMFTHLLHNKNKNSFLEEEKEKQ
ncbi:MAG: hypothetical protein EOM50_09570 [Erysipelotrichia bacterium]|nr:hypothetical protein [Erysipelotrichia bacterium]